MFRNDSLITDVFSVSNSTYYKFLLYRKGFKKHMEFSKNFRLLYIIVGYVTNRISRYTNRNTKINEPSQNTVTSRHKTYLRKILEHITPFKD